MSRYKPGDKFILEVTGVDDSGSRTLYEVKGLSGLCSENMLDKLEKLERVEDVPLRGEWNETKYYTWECSVCGFHPFKGYIPKEPNFNFCPNCGADMRKKVE